MGLFDQIPEAKKASDKNVRSYYERLNTEFSLSEYVAGTRYSVADITLLSAIDFAGSMVNLKPDDNLENLQRWHNQILSRPSSNI
jgi:glutathione S-transferase